MLPVANIYGIIGYIDGEAELDVNLPGITIGPFPILDPKTISFDTDYSGTTVGGVSLWQEGIRIFLAVWMPTTPIQRSMS
jgi:hypothetical protein